MYDAMYLRFIAIYDMLHEYDHYNAHGKAVAHQWLDNGWHDALGHKLEEHSHHKWQTYSQRLGEVTHSICGVYHLEARGKLCAHQEQKYYTYNRVWDIR